MQVLRLNEVLSRVVAWHNRHPLARRVQASQVHSIGEVMLPFASARPWTETAAAVPNPTAAPATPAPRSGSSLADVVSARAAARPPARAAPAMPGAEAQAASPEAADGTDQAADFDPFAPSAPSASTADGGEDGAEAVTPTAASATEPPGEQASDEVADPAAAPEADADAEAEPTTDLANAPARDETGTAALAPADDSVDPAARPDDVSAFSADTADEPAFAPEPAHAPAALPDIDLLPPPEPVVDPSAEATPPPASPIAASSWQPEAPVGWFRQLWARVTGRRPGWPRLEAAFSRDFIWPLTPRQVARWAQRHGQPMTLAPADWPRRQVAPDPAQLGRLRQAGLSHTVHLHVLTAAVGVGDRRIRVLMDADGHIIGPRAYSKPRVASAASLLLAGLLGAGWQWGGLRPAHPAETLALAAQVATAASAASAASPASAASMPHTAAIASAASAASAVLAAAPAATVARALAEAGQDPAHPAASAPLPAAAVSTPLAERVAARATEPHPASATAQHPAGAAPTAAGPEAPPKSVAPIDPPAEAVGAKAAGTATEPAPAMDKATPVGRIRPALSDDDKRLARQQAALMRGAPANGTAPTAAGTAPAPVYAVVTRPTRDRQAAANGLTLMRSAAARMPPPAPDHGELMQSQGEWRAAWWPFASQADAERARVMLVSRGLKAEVVEF